ncbi:hypothetical protein FALBO_13225 [Fusarium albosuccineum]|uniref:Uncharacterized protein n=1 Tax=Fusarium albosuccineum TaxID=1237068 RepID=A0A8H4PGJ2_9HYPO|nr:hypothetical protein FALBO_13225 [Fusarium albosuccineum]
MAQSSRLSEPPIPSRTARLSPQNDKAESGKKPRLREQLSIIGSLESPLHIPEAVDTWEMASEAKAKNLTQLLKAPAPRGRAESKDPTDITDLTRLLVVWGRQRLESQTRGDWSSTREDGICFMSTRERVKSIVINIIDTNSENIEAEQGSPAPSDHGDS